MGVIKSFVVDIGRDTVQSLKWCMTFTGQDYSLISSFKSDFFFKDID